MRAHRLDRHLAGGCGHPRTGAAQALTWPGQNARAGQPSAPRYAWEARNRASSALVGPVAGPHWVTEKAAAALAWRAAAAGAAPDARAARNAPVCVSPAPLVSMGSTAKPGTWWGGAPGWASRQPPGPVRTST